MIAIPSIPSMGRLNGRVLGAVLLAGLAIWASVYLVYTARSQAFDRIAQQFDARSSTLAEATAGSSILQAQVRQELENARSPQPVYLTVRNDGGRVLASSGRWQGWFTGGLSEPAARRWQARAYRALCAESKRDVSAEVTLHIGVFWLDVFWRAGPVFGLTFVLAVLSIGLAIREQRRARSFEPTCSPRRADDEPSEVKSSTPMILSQARERTAPIKARLRSLYTRRARSRHSATGFQVIGQTGALASTTDDTPPIDAKVTTSSEPSPSVDTTEEPSAIEAPDEAPPQATTAPEQDIDHEAASAPVETAEPATDTSEVPGPGLYFQPLWRGAVGGLLAGAIVTLSRPGSSNESPWLTIEELAASSHNEAERRDLVLWLGRRLAAFRDNWCMLELPSIPLIAELPKTLLEFDGANRAWQRVFDGFDADRANCVFCVEDRSETVASPASVRWAEADNDNEDRANERRYRLVDHTGHILCIPKAGKPMAENNEQPIAARELARLVSQCELAPV